MRRNRSAAGFTLIELLVVISIIMIIVSMTVFIIGGFFKGSSVKEGARIVAAAFSRARQQASTTRMVHFLIFDFGNSTMRLHGDANRDRVFTGADMTATNATIAENMPLPQSVYFDRIAGQTAGAPYAVFQPDGSVVFCTPSGAIFPDISWSDPGVYSEGSFTKAPTRSDIVLRLGSNRTDPSDKIYVDVLPVTGLIRKMEYYHRDATTGVLP
jgi:prepilin-type N-terminal cleavage/methylation domain-containing protein